MPRSPFLALVLFAIAATSAAAQVQGSEAAFRTTTMNLSAQGEVRTKPEIVTLILGVSSEEASAQAATAQVMGRANAIVASLRRMGVAQADVQTSGLTLTPRYSSGGSPRTIVGHQAQAMMTVIGRDVDRAGPLLDAAIAAGANEVRGVRFGLSDPATAQRQARDRALATLKEEADHIARQMGQKVVRLVSVNAQAYAYAAEAMNRVEEVVLTGSRVEPGEISVRGSASAIFELAPR